MNIFADSLLGQQLSRVLITMNFCCMSVVCRFDRSSDRKSVRRSVCHYFLIGREVTLPCSRRRTCSCIYLLSPFSEISCCLQLHLSNFAKCVSFFFFFLRAEQKSQGICLENKTLFYSPGFGSTKLIPTGKLLFLTQRPNLALRNQNIFKTLYIKCLLVILKILV